MKAFYSLYGSPTVRRLHLLREGRKRARPSWWPDRVYTMGWCGTAGWDCSDGAGRMVIDPAPEVPPGRLKWCPICVGRALEHAGMLSAVGVMLAQKLAKEGEMVDG